MALTQRTLYVGIGGTGLKIGEALEKALRREVCGVDGDNLKRIGGPFSGIETFELPAFFQSIYVDFAAGDMASLRDRLGEPKIVDKTASFANNLIPAVASSSLAAEYLRAQETEVTKSWLPPDDGSAPQVAPLNSGAGQFPAVGRVSLFYQLSKSDFGIILGNQISSSLGRLAGSMSLLEFQANNATEDLVVYVGFSGSGGTGCGIAYDIIHLIGNHIKESGVGFRFQIVPIMVMPSAFDMLSGAKVEAAKLNTARVLSDFQRLIDHQITDDPRDRADFTVSYPHGIDVHLDPATIQGLFLFEKSVGITPSDLYKGIAENIIGQVSSTNGDTAGAGAVQSWIEVFVNSVPDKREPHGSGIGLRPFIPSMSVSLSVPIEEMSNLLALKLIEDGLGDLTSTAIISTEDNRKEIEKFLRFCGSEVESVIDGKLPPSGVIELRPEKGKNNVAKETARYSNQCDKIATSVQPFARKTLSGAMSLSWASAVETLAAENEMTGLRVIRIVNGDGSLTEANSQKGALQYLSEVSGGKVTAGNKPPLPQSGRLAIGVSTTSAKVQSWRTQMDGWLGKEAKRIWQNEWQLQKGSWNPGVGEMRMSMNRVLEQFMHLRDSARSEFANSITAMEQPSTCVVKFIPLEQSNLELAITELFNRLKEKLAGRLALDAPSSGEIFNKIIITAGAEANGWRGLWADYMRTRDAAGFVFSVRKIITQEIRETLVDSAGPQGSLLPQLSEMLLKCANSDIERDDNKLTESLKAKIGGLFIDGVMPNLPGSPRVLVTYPGEKDKGTEEFLKSIFSKSQGFVKIAPSLVDSNSVADKVTFAPTGDKGESLTISVSVVGQGLLDNPEAIECQRTWREASQGGKGNDISAASLYLAWRQRLSPHDLPRITSSNDQIRILQGLIGALWAGCVEIDSKTSGESGLRRPERIGWKREPNRPPELTFKLGALARLSTWPSIFTAWESEALEANVVKNTALQYFLRPILPSGWYNSDSEEMSAPSEAVKYLLTNAGRELEIIKEIEKEFGSKVPVGFRSELDQHKRFWEFLIPRACENAIQPPGLFDNFQTAYDWVSRGAGG